VSALNLRITPVEEALDRVVGDVMDSTCDFPHPESTGGSDLAGV
jgi:hypothetical protein